MIRLEPIVKTTHRVSGIKMTLKSKCTAGVKKSTAVAAISCKGKDEVVTFLSENSAFAPHGQPAQREVPSDCKSNVGTNVSDSIATKKSDRRKSFTSLLMARSKVGILCFFLFNIFLLLWFSKTSSCFFCSY
ncbi:hypothetical protein CsSME_00017866 [Camellia sinensis var. sinensis]